MNNWEEVVFEDLYSIPSRNGITKPKRVRGSGLKMINLGELFSFGRIGNIDMERAPLSDSEKARFLVMPGDLIFARRSLRVEGAGKCSIVMNTAEATTFESSIIRVRLDSEKCNSLYFYYYFSSYEGKGNIKSIVNDVGVAGIRGSELAKLKVPKPPKQIQDKIAILLSNYDELIETNQKRRIILEKIAHTIYEEWFIKYRYPGHENTPLMEHEELGLVPKGWEIKTVDDVLTKVKSQGKLKRSKYLKNGLFPVVDQGVGDIGGYTNEDSLVHREPLPIIVFGDHSRRLKYVNYPFVRGADGTQILYPDNEIMKPICFYHCLKQIDLSSFGYSRHFKFLKAWKFVVPPINLIDKYEESVRDMFEEIKVLMNKNITLRETRDLLIPRLISGEIDIADIDIEVPEGTS